MENFKKKIIFIILMYGIYYNSVFWFLKPIIFEDPYFLSYIIILYTGGIIDTIFRRIDPEESEEQHYAIYILFLFLINPFLLILGINENEWIFNNRIDILSTIGLIIYTGSVIMAVLSRIQLGKQATGILVIVEDHEIIDTGLYRFVRHPMYAAGLYGVIGFWLLVQSVIIPLLSFILYFMVLHKRAIYEEKLLEKQFGSEYEVYTEKTARYFPYLY